MKKRSFLSMAVLSLVLLLTGCSGKIPEIYISSSDSVLESDGLYLEDSLVERTETEYLHQVVIQGQVLDMYDGDSLCVAVNGNVPFFDEAERQRTDVFEEYAPLDELGRCGVAYANICKELQPVEERGEIGSVKPSGWHTVKYNDLISGNYLYNRCHLIGFQLAGENANERNLITGTRAMNVDGMLPYENQVDAYVDENEANHVLYRVTPVYDGDNLVASGVLMEAYSVEDEGRGVEFCVFVYNVQPGIGIDYSNGNSWALDVDMKKSSIGGFGRSLRLMSLCYMCMVISMLRLQRGGTR